MFWPYSAKRLLMRFQICGKLAAQVENWFPMFGGCWDYIFMWFLALAYSVLSHSSSMVFPKIRTILKRRFGVYQKAFL